MKEEQGQLVREENTLTVGERRKKQLQFVREGKIMTVCERRKDKDIR